MHSTWHPFNNNSLNGAFSANNGPCPSGKQSLLRPERSQSASVKWFHVAFLCSSGSRWRCCRPWQFATQKHRRIAERLQICENALECSACRYSECTFWHWRKDSSGLGTYRSSILLSSLCYWSLHIFAVFARQRVFKATPASCQPTKRGGHFWWFHWCERIDTYIYNRIVFALYHSIIYSCCRKISINFEPSFGGCPSPAAVG